MTKQGSVPDCRPDSSRAKGLTRDYRIFPVEAAATVRSGRRRGTHTTARRWFVQPRRPSLKAMRGSSGRFSVAAARVINASALIVSQSKPGGKGRVHGPLGRHVAGDPLALKIAYIRMGTSRLQQVLATCKIRQPRPTHRPPCHMAVEIGADIGPRRVSGFALFLGLKHHEAKHVAIQPGAKGAGRRCLSTQKGPCSN